MITKNSCLKHQMKILAQSEGVTVESREKAYQYVEKYIMKLLQENALLREDMDHLAAELKEAHDAINAKTAELTEAHDTIDAKTKQCEGLKTEIDILRNGLHCKSLATQTAKGIKAEVKTAKKKAPAKKAAEKK